MTEHLSQPDKALLLAALDRHIAWLEGRPDIIEALTSGIETDLTRAYRLHAHLAIGAVVIHTDQP